MKKRMALLLSATVALSVNGFCLLGEETEGTLSVEVKETEKCIKQSTTGSSLKSIQTNLVQGPITTTDSTYGWKGQGTTQSPYEINSLEDMSQLDKEVKNGKSFEGKYFKLLTDLHLDEWQGNFNGIGTGQTPFNGIFDGNGKTIILNKQQPKEEAGKIGVFGLFNLINSPDAVVKNLNVKSTTQIQCYAKSALGAIVGILQQGTIENCTYEGKMIGFCNVGGIVGRIGMPNGLAIVKDCSVKEGSSITNDSELVIDSATSNHIGGLVGYAFADARITNCKNYASVSTQRNTGCGGIVGRHYNGSLLTGCINYGTIHGKGATGGIAGNVTAHNSADGSAYGNKVKPAYVKVCTNYGDILSDTQMAGDITGTIEIGGYVEDSTQHSNSKLPIVGASSIQIRLYKEGNQSLDFTEVALYQNGEPKYTLTAFKEQPSSPTYPGPFYSYRHPNAPSVYLSIPYGGYDLYIDGKDSGYDITTKGEEILVDTCLRVSKTHLNTFKYSSDYTEAVQFNIEIPQGTQLLGIQNEKTHLGQEDYDFNPQTGKCTLKSQYLSKLEVGEYTFTIVTNQSEFEPISINLSINQAYTPSHHRDSHDDDSTAHTHTESTSTGQMEVETNQKPLVDIHVENGKITSNEPSLMQLTLALSQTKGDIMVQAENMVIMQKAFLNSLKINERNLILAFPEGKVTISSVVSAQLLEKMNDLDRLSIAVTSNHTLEIKINNQPIEIQGIQFEPAMEQPKIVFTDVSEESWCFEAVQKVCKAGLMEGISENLFNPDEPMNRAMMATILWRHCGLPQTNFKTYFKDVPSNKWYSEAVIWAVESGIFNGFGDGTLRPTDEVTREQAVSIMYRYLNPNSAQIEPKETQVIQNYIDVKQISPYATKAFEWALNEKLITGVENQKLEPKNRLTRGQMAVMLSRMILD